MNTQNPPVSEQKTLVAINHLYKDYVSAGGIVTPVLKDINIHITKGEFVAIMGPSGSGKSTFMNILGCLDEATKGEYILSGAHVFSLNKDSLADLRARTLGFVFQGFNLLSRRTALDNVAMPMICIGRPSDEWHPRAEEVLTSVGLSHRLHALPNEMSGGQQQRVAIARALVNRPEIILADEPTGNLDTTTSVDVMKILSELNEKNGLTIILVTHEPDIAAYAKRLIKFRDGIVVYDGPSEEHEAQI